MVITESNTYTANGYTDVLAYGLLGNHKVRLTIHVDGYVSKQSYAQVALWTTEGWKELVRLMTPQIEAYRKEHDDQGVAAMTEHLQRLAKHAKP